MLISTSSYLDGLTIIRFKSNRLRADTLRFVDLACDLSERKGRFGVLLDFSGVKRANMSTIGAFVEVLGRHPRIDFAFCALNEQLKQLISASGMDRHLKFFASVTLALRSDLFSRHFLTSTKAILDLPRTSRQLATTTGANTIAELDVLGRPLIEHFLANLTSLGLREALICAPEADIASIKPVLEKIDHNMCLFFAPCAPRAKMESTQMSNPSAHAFSDIVRHNLPTSKPVLVSAIDGLKPLKARQLEALLEFPCYASAIATAKPHRVCDTDQSGFKFCSADQLVYDVTSELEAGVSNNRFSNETPSVIASRRTEKHNIHSLSKYFSTLQLASKRIATPLLPLGEEIAQNLWRGKGANISPRARINGFCYLASNATIEPEAALKSFTLVGQNATVDRRALLDDCVVLPKSRTTQNQSFQKCFIGEHRLYSLTTLPGQKVLTGTKGARTYVNEQSLGAA